MHIKGIIPISPDSSIFLNQMPTYPHTQTPRESNLSSFIEERNSKLSVEPQSREEAGLSQIKIRDHVFLTLEVKETSLTRKILGGKTGVMSKLSIDVFIGIHLG